jgi:acetyl esterase/lipase
MLAIDGEWLEAVGLDPRRDIAGLIGISGPYDFLPLKDETLKTIFGGDNRPATQPISYVSGNAPRSLLMTGTADHTVNPNNSSRLARRLQAAGADAKVVNYPGVGHLGIIGAFAFPLRFLAPVLNDVGDFIAQSQFSTGAKHAPHT